MKVYVAVCLLAVCCQVYAAHEAVAEFNARGVTGTITFTEISETSVNIVADLTGLVGNNGWHVHVLPVDQTVDPSVQCLGSWVGGHYDPTNAADNPDYSTDCTTSTPDMCEYGDLAGRFGSLPTSGQLDVTDTTGHIKLEGRYSIVGRSIVIHRPDGPHFECGTIRLREELEGASVTILQSIFVSPIAGRMYMKQVEGEDVQIWGKLYWVNDSMTTMNHNWHIHQVIPDDTYRVGECASALAHYDPLGRGQVSGYPAGCGPTTLEACEIGDLSNKLGVFNVAATPSPYSNEAFFFTDTFLNLTGINPAIGRSVVVHVPERGAPRVACAPLVEVENITLTAASRAGESSLATISQYSRYDRTVVTINDLPSTDVPRDLGSDNPDLTIVTGAPNPNTNCPLDGTGTSVYDSTYSPYTLTDNVDTPDGNALGDLSSSYSDEVKSDNKFSAFDLPVYGAMTTISGRTLRFTYGNRRECAALLPMLRGNNIVTAKASFSGGSLGGSIYFVQRRTDDVVSDNTHIIVDIYYNNETMAQTTGHNWHIHQYPPMSGQTCTQAIGGHYNPFMVSLENTAVSSYSTDCTGAYQLRCESGDLSGKHGQLSIAPPTTARPTFAYVDNNLELGGQYTIVNRSVGVHLPSAEGGALFDCAVIEEFEVSAGVVDTAVPVDESTDRISLVRALSEGVTTPDNILVVNQYVSDGCVYTTARVLGADQATANSYAEDIQKTADSQFNNCKSSARGLSTHLLLPVLLLSLLGALLAL